MIKTDQSRKAKHKIQQGYSIINTLKFRLEAYMLVDGCLQPILMIVKIFK